jgi:Domain of unknown function (DUF4126)
VIFTASTLVAAILAISFAAGLNVYATVATLGLLARFGTLTLPPDLHALASLWVIGPGLLLFVVEFFADKIPLFDLIWNALHTFLRVPVAAVLAFGAASQLSLPLQLACAILGMLVAFAAHGGKMALRAGATASPEPFSNSTLSLSEDVSAIGLTVLVEHHPIVSGLLVILALGVILLSFRAVLRATRSVFRRATAPLRRAGI